MFGIQPIELFSVNDLYPVDSWVIPNGTPKTIAFILTKTDSLGTRRYIPSTGSTVQLKLTRARAATASSQAETISKTAIAKPEDRSLYEVALSADDTSKLISGGIQLVVTEGGVVSKVNVPYIIKKQYSDPGY